MDKLFKRKSSRNIKRDDEGDETGSSRIDEQVHIASDSPKLPDDEGSEITQLQLPEIALTGSHDTSMGIPDPPILSRATSAEPILHPSQNRDDKRNNETSNTHEHKIESHGSGETKVADGGDITDQKNTDQKHDETGTESLVEAAMDQAEAQDRHVRFQEHVAESAALVQRMLSVRSGRQEPDNLHNIMQSIPTNFDDDEMEMQSPQSPTLSSGGGSVLASLMRLESQRYVKDDSKKRKKKEFKNENNLKRPMSLYDLPVDSSMNLPSDDNDNLQSKAKLRRPPLHNRPSSWLAGVTSSKYVVPSLEKRKRSGLPALSRRSSVDSMLTTASQFEPITLEERIRITFEIANILQKQEFLRKLCRSLMMYGCPAHRLEYAMRQVSRTLGVDAEYVFLPSVMLITFNDSTTHTTETHFIRQSPGFEMHRLADIYRLEKLVAYGEVSVDEALEFIDKVYEQPPIYPLWLQPFVYALAAFTGCVLFWGGRWKEGGVSAALGMFFAANELFSTIISSFQPIWEITVCILIGFVARGVQKYGFCFTPIAFSSFIVVLPGYPMAVAIIELVSRQLVSGVIRMVYAIIYSFLLGYGVSTGSSLYLTIDKSANTTPSAECKVASNASTCISSVSPWFNFLLVPLFAVTYCVYLKAKLPRWPIMAFVAACGYVINYALSCWAQAPSQILQIAPAFSIALIGNLLSKITGKMSFDAVLLGVFYLVPSGLGVKAALGLFGGGDDSVSNQGAGFALVMIETSIGITLGLFLATLIVYPKGTQRTPLMSL
ncbi:hypothetical protein RMATCC62417_09713 [Rhizopus microsporus]|nr:hypothetical protein RMATCC62417_09713 [Rhizopus microsporus]